MANEERPVQIVADPTLTSSRIYSNYVQVSASPVDCTLTFCEVVGPQNEAKIRSFAGAGEGRNSHSHADSRWIHSGFAGATKQTGGRRRTIQRINRTIDRISGKKPWVNGAFA
jgi:hypothetical protein